MDYEAIGYFENAEDCYRRSRDNRAGALEGFIAGMVYISIEKVGRGDTHIWKGICLLRRRANTQMRLRGAKCIVRSLKGANTVRKLFLDAMSHRKLQLRRILNNVRLPSYEKL